MTLTQPRGNAVLSGTGSFALPWTGAPSVPVAATLTCTPGAQGAVEFELALAVTQTGWTFSSTFPASTLPRVLTRSPTTPGLVWSDSFLAATRVDSPTFVARSKSLRLTGALQPAGALRDYARWVSSWPLSLEGELTLPASASTPVELDLTATSSAGWGIGPLRIQDVGFGLWAGPNPEPPAWEDPAFSELDLVGTLRLGEGDAIEAQLSAPLLGAGQSWRLCAEFGPEGPSLAGGLAAIASLFGVAAGDLSAPPALGGFETFGLQSAEVWFSDDPSTAGFLPQLDAAAVTIGSSREWEPPIPFVRLRDISTRWILTRVPVGAEYAISGGVSGSLVLGSGTNPPVIDLMATLPRFVLTGSLREGTPIPIGEAFSFFFGGPGPDTGRPGMAITAMNVLADPAQQVFRGAAEVTVDWPLPFFAELTLTNVGFYVDASQSQIGGGISGRIQLGEATGAAAFLVRAEYPLRGSAAGWIFSGALENPQGAGVASIVKAFLGVEVAFLEAVVLARLEATVDTAPGVESWSLAGAIAGAWSPTVLGQTVKVKAGAEIALAKPVGASSASGRVSGSFSINRLAVALAGDVGVQEPTYALKVEFDGVWAQATTAWRGEKEARHQIATIQLGGVTLGGLLEYVVNLAAPTLGFELDPPWDALGRIDLARFLLTIDPTEKSIELTYSVEAELMVMYVGTVGVRYQMGEASSVELILTGRFLDQRFTSDKPLQWDVVNDAPPAVPGKGEKLIELRYLALGQRLRFPDDEQPTTVAGAIALLREDMKPVKDPRANPIEKSAMRFDPGSEWLIGLDLSVMETVDVALVFNDPRLYGLSVSLRGDRAGSLAGLRFEVLYRRLAGGIGMFRIELQLPEAFRHIELGAISITLGLVVVEIYTNGSFKVDLGFPYERNFSRSFTAQVFPFIGRGGIYFGVLRGGTSQRVPAISNGAFSPVLELGIGLAVGAGKEISAGPLSGGIYVELEVLFEGVLGWFNPSTQGVAAARYYRGQGLVAIHGKLYAQVDFAVVKASVTLEAYAQASVVFEAYRATVFALEVRVEAEAEVEILWWTVSFSFEVTVDAGFTVGEDEATPWTVTSGQPGPTAPADPLRTPRRLLAAQVRSAADASFDWTAREVLPGGGRPVALSMTPAFSLAGAPVEWSGSMPPNPHPDWRVALLLFAENGVPAEARTVEQQVAPPFDPGAPVPAASLVQCLLLWALGALQDGGEPGKVTAGQLRLLGDALAQPGIAEEAFTFSNLTALLAANFTLTIEGSPKSGGAMALPPLPYLKLTADPGEGHDLSTLNQVGPEYEREVAAYMADFSPVTDPPSGGQGAAAPGGREGGASDEPTSFATYAFRDWCLLATRTAVREAGAALERFPVPADPARSLDALAAGLPTDRVSYTVRAGDTVASVADYLGTGVAELEALNPTIEEALERAAPGDQLTIVIGVSGATLALENATEPLAPGSTVTLSRLRLQLRSGDTLDGVSAALYGSASAARLVEAASLGADRSLLAGGAAVSVPERPAPLGGQPGADLLAATFYVRYYDDLEAPLAGWYAEAIANEAKNHEALSSLDPGEAIPAGTSLEVPAAPSGSATTSYTTVTGDTLLRIGATLSLSQTPGAYAGEAWQRFRAAVLAAGGNTVPATEVAIGGGETPAELLARLVYPDPPEAAVPSWLSGAAVLAPLATIEVAGVPLAARAYPTLAAIAKLAGLSVAELARRPDVTGDSGAKFAAGTTLWLSHLPARDVEGLVEEVCGGERLARISNQVSRHMLAGTRLPFPEPDTSGPPRAKGPLTGLARIAGLEFASPQVDGVSSLTLSAEKALPDLAWLEFSPAPLAFEYSNAELAERYPASGLAVSPHGGPAAIPLGEDVPLTHGLDHRTPLQTAVPLAVPNADPALNPSLWRFPAAVLARARGANPPAYDLYRAGIGGGGVATHPAIGDSTFGTLVPFSIRRVPGAEGVYELLGADGEDRSLLLELALYARGDSADSKTAIYLAIAPAPGMTEPAGLALLDASSQGTFAVRANMATDVKLAAAPSVRIAAMDEVAAFVQLLWEASVAGGGFQLTFAGAAPGGGDLPAGAFAEDGTATLWLLAIPREQQQPPPATGRPLLAIDNCALVGAGLDATANALYLEAHDATAVPGEHVRQALVPAGSVGATLTLPRAPRSSEAPPEDQAQARLRQLFSLLTVSVGGDYPHALTSPAAPPQRDDGRGLPLWRRQREQRAALSAGAAPADPAPAGYWRYEQVFPVTQWASTSATPAIPGLPPPAADPYAGFGEGPSLATAKFAFGFSDVIGNATQEPPGESVEVEVGYTDPLLGPGAWPGTTSSYAVSRVEGEVTLTIAVGSQPAAIAPGRTASATAAREAVERQAERYREAYYQLSQPTVSVFALTTLSQDSAGDPQPIAVADGRLALWRFAAGGYLFANAVATLAPPSPGGPTLGDVTARFGHSAAALATVNADRAVAMLFASGQTATVEPRIATRLGDSAETIVARVQPPFSPPAGAAALLTQNAAAPLRPGTVLATPAPVAVSLGPEPASLTLAKVAAEQHTTPAQLALDTASQPILRPGFSFESERHAVVTGSAVASFAAVRDTFAEAGIQVTLPGLAEAVEGSTGIFADGAQPSISHLVSSPGDSFATLAPGAATAALAAANVAVVDLYEVGLELALPSLEAPLPTGRGTLAEFAEHWASTPAAVLAANQRLTLATPIALELPGAASPPPATAQVPYGVVAGDSLDAIAAVFGPGVENLAEANALVPGMLAGGHEVTVTKGGQPVKVQTLEGDSLTDLWRRFVELSPSIEFADVVAALAGEESLLAAGALVVVPAPALARRAGLAGSGPMTQSEVAQTYMIDPLSFAQANATIVGLLQPGVTLNAPGAQPQTTTAQDSLNAVLGRFAAAGVELTLAELLAANEAAPLYPLGTRVLLPPPAARVAVSLGAGGGPFAEAVFPLSVTLRLQREEGVVHPDLREGGEGPVERADVPVPAPATPTGDQHSETFNAFVDAFLAAFPQLRLGTAKVAGERDDLWAVDFGAEGIASVTVAPGVAYPAPGGSVKGPRYFALRPPYAALQSRVGVPVQPVEDADGTLGTAVPTDFQGADVEVWARRFLGDLDFFLCAPYASAIHAHAAEDLDRLLQAKWTLSQAVAAGLAPVLSVSGDSRVASGRAAAATDFARLCGSSLSAAYEVATVLQYDATVTAGQGVGHARLSGLAQRPLDAGATAAWSLSGAPTALDSASSFVDFALTLPDAAHSERIDTGALEYVYDSIEFDVSEAAGVDGYELAKWLSFVRPLSDAYRPSQVSGTLDAANVPIPLRTHPSVPLVVSQTAEATYAGAREPTLAQAALWTYGIAWSHEHAAQDEVLMTVTFNVDSRPKDMLNGGADLAAELFKYAAHADRLRELMSWYVEPPTGTPATIVAAVRENVAGSVATLASAIAEAWTARWESAELVAEAAPPAGVPGLDMHSFRLKAVYPSSGGDDAPPKLEYLLAELEGDAGPGPGGRWPDAACLVDGKWVPLQPSAPPVPGDRRVRYEPPPGVEVPVPGRPTFRLQWPDLNLAGVENARASLAAHRNEHLVEGVPTNAAFVLSSAQVDAPDVAVPLLEWSLDFPISGADFAAALQSGLTTLFGSASDRPLTSTLDYGYKLVPPTGDAPGSGLTTFLPVALYPSRPLEPAAIAAALAGAAAAWERAGKPTAVGGEWAVSLTLSSLLEPSSRPLLVLERLVYSL